MFPKAARLNNDLMTRGGSFYAHPGPVRVFTCHISCCRSIGHKVVNLKKKKNYDKKKYPDIFMSVIKSPLVGLHNSPPWLPIEPCKYRFPTKWSPNPQPSDIISFICPQSSDWYVRAYLQNFKVLIQTFFFWRIIRMKREHLLMTTQTLCCNLCRVSCRNGKSSCFPF